MSSCLLCEIVVAAVIVHTWNPNQMLVIPNAVFFHDKGQPIARRKISAVMPTVGSNSERMIMAKSSTYTKDHAISGKSK